MTDIHSCSYYCERPECVRRQRDEMRDRLADRDALAARCEALLAALRRIDDLCDVSGLRRDYVYIIGQIEGEVERALAAPDAKGEG